MTEEFQEEVGGAMLDTVMDSTTDVLTGSTIPAPIKKNLFKAISQLCTAAVDIPVSYLEGKATENRAETNARVSLIEVSANQIAEKMDVAPEYAKIAVEKYGQKIVKEQINLDGIVQIATNEIKESKRTSESVLGEKEISDDWLNSFEKEACQKSSHEMKLLFGKILAGEIQKPSSYSIRTVRLLSQLDNAAAEIFNIFCSLCVSFHFRGEIVDARVISISGTAGSNSLKKYALPFNSLNILEEYGLIISDFDTTTDYGGAILRSGKVSIPMRFQKSNYGFAMRKEVAEGHPVKVRGVMLSRTGKELFELVDVIPNQEYFNDLKGYFKSMNIELVPIAT